MWGCAPCLYRSRIVYRRLAGEGWIVRRQVSSPFRILPLVAGKTLRTAANCWPRLRLLRGITAVENVVAHGDAGAGGQQPGGTHAQGAGLALLQVLGGVLLVGGLDAVLAELPVQ